MFVTQNTIKNKSRSHHKTYIQHIYSRKQPQFRLKTHKVEVDQQYIFPCCKKTVDCQDQCETKMPKKYKTYKTEVDNIEEYDNEKDNQFKIELMRTNQQSQIEGGQSNWNLNSPVNKLY